MVNVSNEFLTIMQERRDFTAYAEVTFLDEKKIVLEEQDFTIKNNRITDSAGASGIPLGVAVCKTIQMEIANFSDQYSAYDFWGAKIFYEIKFRLSETTEIIPVGQFTVIEPQTYGETIIVTAVDNMYKANGYYATTLSFPATIGEILRDICSNYDIPLQTTSFRNDDFVIQERPTGNYIARNLIGYIAMIAGGNARINRNGYLEIVSYDFSVVDLLSGGTFSPWTEGDVLSGGTLNPLTEGDTVSGGIFDPWTEGASSVDGIHVLDKFRTLTVDTDNVLITGVQIEAQDGEETTAMLIGEEGYVLFVENPLVAGQEEEFLNRIGSILINGQMRRFEGEYLAYPLADFMDPCVVVDRKGNMYPSVLTDIEFTFFDVTTFKNTAESPEEAYMRYDAPAVDVIKIAKDLVAQERTDRERAIENLNNALSNSSGMYSTDVGQADGSAVRYLHDKPTLAESQNVIKITADAIGISNDGGETFPYGITLNGETITRILYTEGINADYINAGTITADRLKLEGLVTVDGNIRVLEDGTIEATNGTFSGNVTTEGQLTLIETNEESGAVSTAYIKMSETVYEYNPYVFIKNEESGLYETATDGYVFTRGHSVLQVDSRGFSVGDMDAYSIYATEIQYDTARGKSLRGETAEFCNLEVLNGIDLRGAKIDYTGIYNQSLECVLPFNGVGRWVLSDVGDSYESVEVNGIRLSGKSIYPNSFPNSSFLVVLRGVNNPTYASMYLFETGDAETTDAYATKLSKDMDIYPVLARTTSGYARAQWVSGSGITDSIVASIYTLV